MMKLLIAVFAGLLLIFVPGQAAPRLREQPAQPVTIYFPELDIMIGHEAIESYSPGRHVLVLAQGKKFFDYLNDNEVPSKFQLFVGREFVLEGTGTSQGSLTEPTGYYLSFCMTTNESVVCLLWDNNDEILDPSSDLRITRLVPALRALGKLEEKANKK